MSIALWCVLVAGLLPMLVAGYAKKRGGRYDNAKPRESATHYEGEAKRAYAAHQNCFEAFPLFAAAVLLAEMKGAPRGIIDVLALAHIGLRLTYVWTYIVDKPTARSLVWGLALLASIYIFLSPLVYRV
jgi:uncharacterized MAPEG superfamily protein